MLRDQLGEDASVAALPEMIHQRTKGNPFFIEEVVQSLVGRGHLAGERGAYDLTTAIAALEVPATVQALLGARIDRLPVGAGAWGMNCSHGGSDNPVGKNFCGGRPGSVMDAGRACKAS